MSDVDPVPEFGERYHGCLNLKCPQCGGQALHQHGVDVYVRSEDDDEGLHVDVNHRGSTEVTTNVTPSAGNPSSRRSGIRIQFWCEHCPEKSELVISQHKGIEELYWENE